DHLFGAADITRWCQGGRHRRLLYGNAGGRRAIGRAGSQVWSAADGSDPPDGVHGASDQAGFPPRKQYYDTVHFLREIRDEAISLLIDHFSRVSSPLSSSFSQQTGGAMQRGNTAYAHRDALYNFILVAQWLDPKESQRHVRWTRDLWEALQPYSTGGFYVNDIGREEDDGADRVWAAYGHNYERLAALKKQYDPDTLFRHNQNIKPAV